MFFNVKDDIERIYQSMCRFIYNNYKEEKDDEEVRFIKHLKREKRDGLCFACKGEKDDESVKNGLMNGIMMQVNIYLKNY